MDINELPMNNRSVFTSQLNLKMDKAMKADIDLLRRMDVNVSALLRQATRQAIDYAFKVLEKKRKQGDNDVK
jgi:hypothetical protein